MERSNDKRYCNYCQRHVNTTQTLCDGPHYARENCVFCGRFVAFTKKPENNGKRAQNKYTAKDLGIDYCQLCLRASNRLGKRGVLEVHHVQEIQSGGIDEPSNIWVLCTACHRLTHHQRTYLNIHLQDMYTLKELRSDMKKYGVPKEAKEIIERMFLHQEAENA